MLRYSISIVSAAQRSLSLLLLLVAVAGFSGCAMIGTPSVDLPVDGPAPGVCQVKVKATGRKVKTIAVPVTPQMRLQDVVVATKSDRKFRRMLLTIVRDSPRTPGEKLRLESNYDSKKDEVTWNTDYAILPGDEVFIEEDSSTIVDDMVESVVPALFRGQ